MPWQDPAGVASAIGDADLVSAALAGDERALRAIWDRYAPLARRVVGRSFGPGCESEDVVQDVFLGLFKNLRAVRDPSALRAFVISICVRKVREEIRKRRLRRLIGLCPEPELAVTHAVSSDHESRQSLAHLYGMLERLPFRERTIFVLRQIEGLEIEEVSAALDISHSTVRRGLAKANERLTRWSLDDEGLSFYLPVRK